MRELTIEHISHQKNSSKYHQFFFLHLQIPPRIRHLQIPEDLIPEKRERESRILQISDQFRQESLDLVIGVFRTYNLEIRVLIL
jgi:hypothetical protein